MDVPRYGVSSYDLTIILANSAEAKIYSYHSNNKQLLLLTELTHPKSKLKIHEIVADEAGRYQKSASPNQGTYEPPTDPKTVEAIKFSGELVENILRLEKKTEKYVIIAPGHFQHFIKDKLGNSLLAKNAVFF